VPKAKGRLVSKSPLHRISRQVRTEVEGALYLCVPVQAYVTNFDFSHVVDFLDNKLSDNELRTFSAYGLETSGRSNADFHILLVITKDCPARYQGLDDWLSRYELPDKRRGIDIDISYQSKPPEGYQAYNHARNVQRHVDYRLCTTAAARGKNWTEEELSRAERADHEGTKTSDAIDGTIMEMAVRKAFASLDLGL
jgi:hypothetical protein